ncbi:MAG: hypothetical protein IBX40_00525 [Methanosarcinales archaeon]|nr:hypothetical protein [Methanosarcinales archaeon]
MKTLTISFCVLFLLMRSTVNPTATKAADDSATSVATVSGGEAYGEGVVAESTEIADETNGSSGEDNKGIPGFQFTCRFAGLVDHNATIAEKEMIR